MILFVSGFNLYSTDTGRETDAPPSAANQKPDHVTLAFMFIAF